MKNLVIQNRQKGLTLVEIMIALLLGLFLLTGVIQIFIGSKQSYRMQENISRMQENGRFALHFLKKDIRMAGYWGCVKDISTITNHLDPAGTDYDANIHLFTVPVTGTDGTTDSITLRGAFDSGIRVTSPFMPTPAGALHIEPTDKIEQADIAMVSDCRQADIFQITPSNITTSGTVTHNTGAEDPGNLTKNFSKTYEDDARIFKLRTTTYTIQNGVGGLPGLFREFDSDGAEELIEGIENMQILYGFDNDGNKTPDYFIPAAVGLDYSNVISVRVSLLAYTPEDNITSQAIPYAYNGATVSAPGDRRKRLVFDATIALRNRLP